MSDAAALVAAQLRRDGLGYLVAEVRRAAPEAAAAVLARGLSGYFHSGGGVEVRAEPGGVWVADTRMPAELVPYDALAAVLREPVTLTVRRRGVVVWTETLW